MTDLKELARQAMRVHGLWPDFPAEVWQQTGSIAHAAVDASPAVRDLRSLPWASIDNDDSRDLDQLSVAESLAAGAVRVLIAIADVDALVTRGTPIDGYAAHNTTSVYTVAQVFPMLPERLSTDLSSLAQGQERLAIIVEMTIGTDGALMQSDVYRAVVINKAKLAYNAVAAWLENGTAAPAAVLAVPGLDQQLRIQDRVAQALRQVRHERGALTLRTLETRAVFDGPMLRDLRPDESNRAKELIEDFMIAANGVVARFLHNKGFASLRRVLSAPKRWDRIGALAQSLGESLPPAPDARALNNFLTRRRQADPSGFADLSLSAIKLLGRGEYVLERPGQPIEGHFGLAVSDYTHSTAPNRRYPDLLTQRLLKCALLGRLSPYSAEELEQHAAHCTLQEDAAAKVERQMVKSAAALLLAPVIGQQFDALVTGAADKGTWVRIAAPSAEGRLTAGFEGLEVGASVRVRLVHTDVARGFIDFSRVR